MDLNLKKTFSAGVAGIVAGAALSMSAAFAEPAANTNAPQAQTTAVTAEEARVVFEFEYGDDINPETVESVVRFLSARGCPASAIKGTNVPPGTVMVNTDGDDKEMFEDPGAAGKWALDHCKSSSVDLN